ncbi:hypothetical protein P9112_005558 [Eukaryota sp. TZLM1-RC]
MSKRARPHRRLTIKPHISLPIRWKSLFTNNTIYDVLKNRPNWEECSDDVDNFSLSDIDFLWADIHFIRTKLPSNSTKCYCNHYRNHYELTRKDLLVKNLKRTLKVVQKTSPESAYRYEFFPSTFVLPGEYALFLEAFRKEQGTWIMKPSARAQGRGIFLISKPSEVLEWKRSLGDSKEKNLYIIQKYIQNPFLIGGRKFDIRFYVLVLSYSPLLVYLYREGFARFSSSRFSMSQESIGDSFVHLTNVAIQKKSNQSNHVGVDDIGGHYSSLKWSLNSLLLYLTSLDPIKSNNCFLAIQDLVFRSLSSVCRNIIVDPLCFELYGFDVLIDENFKPWLIEINASPSLSASDSADYELKSKVLTDMLNLLDLEGQFPINSDRVGGFEKIVDGDYVCPRVVLGCSISDREDQLENLKNSTLSGCAASK